MMIERIRETVGGIDWIRAGQVLGVPAMGMLFLLVIGFYFVRAQASQWASDSETRQELLTKLVEAQIKQGEATTTTMVRAQASMEKLEKIAEQQSVAHVTMIETQKQVIENQGKIVSGIQKDYDTTKELIVIQKKILDVLGHQRAPPAKATPTPRDKPT